MESSVDSVMARSCPVAQSTVHRTLDTPSIVVERPRPAAYPPIAKFPIATIDVATFATPIVAGASSPVAPPAKAPIVVLAYGADPIALAFPPRLGKRTPFPAETTLQVVECVH